MSKVHSPMVVSTGPRVLDDRDAKAFSKAARVQTTEIVKSVSSARKYLVEGGFITKTGKLTGKYSGQNKK